MFDLFHRTVRAQVNTPNQFLVVEYSTHDCADLSICPQDKDSSDQSVNVTEQDDGQTWDDIKVCACMCVCTVNAQMVQA